MNISFNLLKILTIGLLLSSLNAETNIVKTGNTQIEYFTQGQGDTILLLSGRGLDVGYLENLAISLASKGYRAIRINRRGAGKSTGVLDNINYHIHADDVANVVKSLGIKKVNVLGHALGGRIARVFAADYPELASSVILMPASGKVQGDPEEAKATSKLFVPNATEAEIMNGMQFMVGDPKESQRVWDIIKPSTLIDRPLVLKSEASMKTPLEEWWAPEGTTPYLVVQGLKDKSAPPKNAQLLKEELGERVSIVELPQAGHLAPVEYPNEVASAIISLLNSQKR